MVAANKNFRRKFLLGHKRSLCPFLEDTEICQYTKDRTCQVVVADARAPRDGRFIEEIGTYDPNQDPSVFKFDEEKAKKWLANGAKPTETVGKLLKEAGIAK